MPFLLITFSTLKSFLICFLQFFFAKRSYNFFDFKITNNICPQSSFLIFCNTKNVFRSIWNTAFCKNVFIFWYYHMIADFKYRTFLIIFFIKVNIHAWIYIKRFHFNPSMICVVKFINYLSYKFFDNEVKILLFKVLINLSATTDFPSLSVKYISIAFFSNHDFIDLLQNSLVYCKIHCFYQCLVCLVCD